MPEQLINQTSTAIQSYHSEQSLVKNINAKVYDLVLKHGKMTRNDIKRHSDFTARQISCATWHLIKKGKLRTCGTAKDRNTLHEIELVEVNPTPEIVFRKKSDKERLKEIRELCDSIIIDEHELPYKSAQGIAEDIISIIDKK